MPDMNRLEDSSLGKSVAYVGSHDPGLLFPIARSDNRAQLGIDGALPFLGVDIWNAYELSWLDARGKPRVALAEFRIPVGSPNIIESKSFKLYLNSYMQTRVADTDALRVQLAADLSTAAGAPVSVVLATPTSKQASLIENLAGEVIDDLPIEISHYGPPRPDFLYGNPDAVVEESVVSHLFKSNCPVTGQPGSETAVELINGSAKSIRIYNKRDGVVYQVVINTLSEDNKQINNEYIRMDKDGKITGVSHVTYIRRK